jgi:lactaldehyde reductase
MGAVGIDAMSIDAARVEAVRLVYSAAGLSVLTSLRTIGASKEGIPALVAAALVDVCAGGNPREARLQDVVALYTAAF